MVEQPNLSQSQVTKILCKLEPASNKYRNKQKSKHWDIMPDKQTQTQAPGHNAAPDGGKLRPARQMRNIPPLVVPNNSQFVCCPAAPGGIFFFRIEIYEVSCCTKG